MITKPVVVEDGQNLLDLSISVTGSIEAAFEIARLNNLRLDRPLAPGTTLWVPTDQIWYDAETLALMEAIGSPVVGTGDVLVNAEGGSEFNNDFNSDFA